MKKFMILFMSSPEAMKKWMTMSPEDQAKGMEMWKSWMESNAEKFTDMGSPLGKNTRVTKDGATEASNEVGGYSIVQANSVEEVTELLKDSPHFADGSEGVYVEVMEIKSM